MGLFAIFLVLILFTPNFRWLIVCLFGMGLALGCDYPTAHLVISESTNTSRRGALVLGAFGFQAVGALAGMAIGLLILYANPELGAWRWMYATAILPALLVTLGRLFVTESPHWLVSRGDERNCRAADGPPAGSHAALPDRGHAERTSGKRRGAGIESAWLFRALPRQEPAGDDLRVGAVVPAGSRHVRDRHLHADHPRGGGRATSAPMRKA